MLKLVFFVCGGKLNDCSLSIFVLKQWNVVVVSFLQLAVFLCDIKIVE